jgi:hypothetical protein
MVVMSRTVDPLKLPRRRWWRGPGLAGVVVLTLSALAWGSTRRPQLTLWLSARQLKADHRLQEAEWLLRRAGRIQQAERTHAELEQVLGQGRVLRMRQLGRSTFSDVQKVDLAGGVSGVWKREGGTLHPGGDQAPRKEIAASRLDRLLGLGRVPLTVARTIDGRPGSLQYFVRDVASGSSLGMHSWNADRSLQFLDALMANWDRHAGNFLINAQGHQIAIDHNLAFDEQKYRRPADLLRLVPTRAVYLKLKALNDATLRAELADVLLADELDALVRRKHELVEILDSLSDHGRLEAVFDQP